jgi:hypothetical protein
MSGISIGNYVEGVEPQLQDPTDPYEQVERKFMDKLARIITRAEEALQAGTSDVDSDEFYGYRGDFLDLLEDQQLVAWLQHMRVIRRAPFRRFKVKDEPEEENAEPV